MDGLDTRIELVEDLKRRYILPHDMKEIERMQNQHEWVKACAKGLVKAPINLRRGGLRVLDSATADGIVPFAVYLSHLLISCRFLDEGCGISVPRRH